MKRSMQMNCVSVLIGLALFQCGSKSSVEIEKMDLNKISTDSVVPDSSVDSVKDDNIPMQSEINQIDLLKRLRGIWKHLPVVDDANPNGYLTADFSTTFQRAVVRRNKQLESTVEEEQDIVALDLGEFIYGWYGAQDPNPEGILKIISHQMKYPNRLMVVVNYQGYPQGAWENHELILTMEDGEWYLDDFDGMKSKLKRYISTGEY